MSTQNASDMSLDEFIRKTIVEITKGVADASKEIQALGGETNPRPYGEGAELAQAGVVRARGSGSITYIDFDVEVTASSGQKRAAGIKVLFAGIGPRLEEENQRGAQRCNRVQFRVPITLP
jgi:hypothetical protein